MGRTSVCSSQVDGSHPVLSHSAFAPAAFLKTVELILDGLRGNVVATKRDLYYRCVKVFGKQARVDAVRSIRSHLAD